MAIEMTREEYQKAYGAPPALPSTSAPPSTSKATTGSAGQSLIPKGTPGNMPNQPVGNAGYNLQQLPGQLTELGGKIPGVKTVGDVIGTALAYHGVGTGQPAPTQEEKALIKQTMPPPLKAAGAALEVSALPATGLETAGLKTLARYGVNAGIGAALTGGNTAEQGGSITDTLKSAGYGAAGGAALTGVGQAIPAVVGATKNLPSKLLSSPIPTRTAAALKETPTPIFDKITQIGRDATQSNKAITPLEHVGDRAQEALDQVQRKAATIGKNKSAIIGQASVGRKPVGNIVLKFRQGLQNAIGNATGIQGDDKMVADIMHHASMLGKNPSARQVDSFIDFAQDRIYTGGRDLTVPVTDKTTALLRQELGKLNGALKDQLPSSYRNLNAAYHDLIGTRNELNSKLGVGGEKGGALMKRVFSPSDANTKKLFAAIQKITGIDLTNEATIAKHVMETLGDARQKSMLEQLNLPRDVSLGNFAARGFEKVKGMVNTPEAILERSRQLTRP